MAGRRPSFGKVLTQWGIDPFPFVDGTSSETPTDVLTRAARQGPAKMVYLETPANPTNILTNLALVPVVIMLIGLFFDPGTRLARTT